MRSFKQFYVEFDAVYGARNYLPELAAVVANALGTELERIEFRDKDAAEEYRIVTKDGLEAKVGCNVAPRIWLHLSAPEDMDVDLRKLAYEIINHPKFMKVNREKGGEESEG